MPTRNEDTTLTICASTNTMGTVYPIGIELEGTNDVLEEFDRIDGIINSLNTGYYFCGANICPSIKKVIFNPPATIILWHDGSKTVVKCSEDDEYNEYAGMAICIAKKVLGSKFHKVFNKWVGRSKDGE